MSFTYYRTKDGLTDYGFSFERQNDGSWRAYIINMPSYGSRDGNNYVTHRKTDGSRSFVCWSRDLYSENEMRRVAAKWADLTQVYIRTGRTIDEQGRNGG